MYIVCQSIDWFLLGVSNNRKFWATILPMKEVIGQVLRLLRKETGLSQEALADRAGITKNYLSELERGKKLPSYITLSKMAHSLNMHHWQLTKRIEEQIQHCETKSAIAKISPKEAEPDWNQNFATIHEQGRFKARLRISKILEQNRGLLETISAQDFLQLIAEEPKK